MKSDTQLVQVVDPNAPIFLGVVIGEGAAGGTTILWNDTVTPLPDPPANPQGALITQQGGQAHYRTLHCSTDVKDVSEEHNRTSVRYVLTNAQPAEFPYAQEVPRQGDWAKYAISFVFVPK